MTKPTNLKVLTLDGGGLQALTTLSILNSICNAIAAEKGTTRAPAPCELFDVIGGVGTGAWLAILLGYFRLDVSTCMAVYMDLVTALDPRASFQGLPKIGASRFDKDQLIAKVKCLVTRYNVGENLLDAAEESSNSTGFHIKCKHTFAIGVVHNQNNQQEKYQLFRTYRTTRSSDPLYHPGPEPSDCKVWDVFAATAAAKYFLPPHTIKGTMFSDSDFPLPHNVTNLTLDEVFHIYGKDAAISVIANVAPGLPSSADYREIKETAAGPVKKLARKFSWPNGRKLKQWCQGTATPSDSTATMATSEGGRDKSLQALQREREIEDDVKGRLARIYPLTGESVYHHIGPDFANVSVSLNDVSVVWSGNMTDDFLQKSQASIRCVARQYCCVAAST